MKYNNTINLPFQTEDEVWVIDERKVHLYNEWDCSGGWILCKNKMPEIGKPVLVCDKQGNVCVRAITCEIKGKKYWSQDKYDVVAWQPLPEPYHEP